MDRLPSDLSPEQAAILHLLARVEALEMALRNAHKRLDRLELETKKARRQRAS